MTIEAGQIYDNTVTQGKFYTVLLGGPTTGGYHPTIVTYPNGATHVGSIHQRMIDDGTIWLHVEKPPFPERWVVADEDGGFVGGYPALAEALHAARRYRRPYIHHLYTDANGDPQVEVIEVDL